MKTAKIRYRIYKKDASRKRRVLNRAARNYQKGIQKTNLKASKKLYGKDSNEYRNAERWHNTMKDTYIRNYKSGSSVGYGKKYESAYLRGESSRADYAVSRRQKSLAGHVDSFMQKHGNTVANIMNASGNIVDAGVSTVKSYASTTVSSIKSTGSKAISSGKSFINSLFGKKEKPNKSNTRYDDYPY